MMFNVADHVARRREECPMKNGRRLFIELRRAVSWSNDNGRAAASRRRKADQITSARDMSAKCALGGKVPKVGAHGHLGRHGPV